MGAIGDPYITLPQLKSYLSIPVASTQSDAELTYVIGAASREVEGHCNRQFNKATSATPRTYSPQIGTIDYWAYSNTVIRTDDFCTDAGLIVEVGQVGGSFSQPWQLSELELLPRDGVVGGVPGFPFTRISVPPWNTVFYLRERVRVTAVWGWDSVPAPVIQATLMLAAYHYKTRDAPLGSAGFNQGLGVVKAKSVPEVCALLEQFVSRPVLIA